MFKRYKITTLSFIGFIVLIFAVLLSYFTELYVFDNIKKQDQLKNSLQKIYDDIFRFKYNSELLLTSHNVQERKKSG